MTTSTAPPNFFEPPAAAAAPTLGADLINNDRKIFASFFKKKRLPSLP